MEDKIFICIINYPVKSWNEIRMSKSLKQKCVQYSSKQVMGTVTDSQIGKALYQTISQSWKVGFHPEKSHFKNTRTSNLICSLLRFLLVLQKLNMLFPKGCRFKCPHYVCGDIKDVNATRAIILGNPTGQFDWQLVMELFLSQGSVMTITQKQSAFTECSLSANTIPSSSNAHSLLMLTTPHDRDITMSQKS